MFIAVIIFAALIAVTVYLIISIYIVGRISKLRRLPLDTIPEAPYQDVSFPSLAGNITIRGWHFPGGPDCIIIVSGGEQNRADEKTGTVSLAQELVRKGYSALLFDLHGRGESGGNASMLAGNDLDIGGAVDFARSQSCRNIYIIGFSAGAAASLLYASRNSVSGVVSDSCFADTREMFLREADRWKLPKTLAWIFAFGVFLMARAIYGFKRADPEDIVKNIASPVFFINGDLDSGVPVNDANRLYQSGGNTANRQWVVAGAEHTQAYRTDPAQYIENITGFFSSISAPDS